MQSFAKSAKTAVKWFGKLTHKLENCIIRVDPLAWLVPGTKQDALHTRPIHQFDEVSRSQVLAEQVS